MKDKEKILIRGNPCESAEKKLGLHPQVGVPHGFYPLAAFFCSFAKTEFAIYRRYPNALNSTRFCVLPPRARRDGKFSLNIPNDPGM